MGLAFFEIRVCSQGDLLGCVKALQWCSLAATLLFRLFPLLRLM